MTLTAVCTPDEDGWTMAQLAEWPAVVTCGRTVEEAREMLLDGGPRDDRLLPRSRPRAADRRRGYRAGGDQPRRLKRGEFKTHLREHGGIRPPSVRRPECGNSRSERLSSAGVEKRLERSAHG
jgi:hypothetical protein